MLVRKKPPPSLPVKDESDSDAAPEPALPPGRSDKKPAHVMSKEQTSPKKTVPSQPPRGGTDQDHTAEAPRPTPGKKPAAPQKPSLPPKKPLPVKTKKPDITGKKLPEKKVEPDKTAAVKKSMEDTRERADSKQAESSHVKETPKDDEHSKPMPVIKTENVEEGTCI